MDSYKYIDGEYEIRQEIKRSVFIATAKGELDGEGAEEFVRGIKKRYPDATHNCYAYISDELGNATRFSDDGEPGGTAGQPILEVLKKHELRRTAIVVTRYFGGIKLGAGGLVGAYSGAAAEVVKAAKTATKERCELAIVLCDYQDLSAVQRAIRNADCAPADMQFDDVINARVFVKCGCMDAFEASVSEATFGRAKITKTGVYEFKNLK